MFISYDALHNPVFSGLNGTLLVSKKEDYYPKTELFEVSRTISGNYRPKIHLSDKENQADLSCILEIIGPLVAGADNRLVTQRFIYGKQKLIDFPSSIFKQGETYTFRLKKMLIE